MGLEQTVRFAQPPPAWAAVRDFLMRQRYPVQLRMIDGQLSLPDEQPPDGWRELRVGTPHGMVTVRREADCVSFVVWGNADPDLLRARNALVVAFAEAGGGEVQTEVGTQTGDRFRSAADLPDDFRDPPA